jgi:hypothetical protein
MPIFSFKIAMLFCIQTALAQLVGSDVVAGNSCAGIPANATRVVADSDSDRKGVVLICDGSVWVVSQPSITGPCAGGNNIVYNATTGGVSCASTCSDTTPNTINFTNTVTATASALTTSNILQVTGFDCQVSISVSGEGSPQFRTCSDAACSSVIQDWTASSSGIVVNNYVQLRLTAAAAGGDTRTANLSVGNTVDDWNVTPTGDCTPADPVPGTVCVDGSIYAGKSVDGNVKMYTTRCDEGFTWTGAVCSGVALGLAWNNQNGTGYVTTSYNSHTTGAANTTALAALDSNSGVGGTQPHQAAKHCEDSTALGYTDWYLPAYNELLTLYLNQTTIGNFFLDWYWSSSENDSSNARDVHFSDGSTEGVGHIHKGTTHRLRCVRK